MVEHIVAYDADEFGGWGGYRVPLDRSGWHPLVGQLYNYWLSISPADGLPGRQHMLPEDIGQLWTRLWLLDVVRGPPLRYRYRFCGSGLARAFGAEVTGRWLDEAHPQLIANPQFRERFRFTVMTGRPTWRRGPPLWTCHRDYRTFESCIVPLAADGTTVDKILGIAVAFNGSGKEI